MEEVKGAGLPANGKEYFKTSKGKELRKVEEVKGVRIRAGAQVGVVGDAPDRVGPWGPSEGF